MGEMGRTLDEKAMNKPRKTGANCMVEALRERETTAVQGNKITEVGAKRKGNLKPLLRRPGRI